MWETTVWAAVVGGGFVLVSLTMTRCAHALVVMGMEYADALRYVARVHAGLIHRKEPEPPPTDPRMEVIERWLARQRDLTPDEAEDLRGCWAVAIGVRLAEATRMAAARQRLRDYGAPDALTPEMAYER